MKTFFRVSLLTLVAFLVSGFAFAAVPQNSVKPSVKYTPEQQSCIKSAQEKRMSSTKFITQASNEVTKGAMESRRIAIQKAQSLTDKNAKASAMKAAMEAYNNNAAVKEARVPYMAKIKEVNSQFQEDQKACLAEIGVVGFFRNIFKSVGAGLAVSLTADNPSSSKKIVPAPSANKVQLTDKQKACIKSAQDKRSATMKPVADAIKSQTADALKIRQEAIATAQKIKDAKAKSAAIKKAMDVYNADATVKQVTPAYATAVKAANDQFQKDQKACIGSSASGKIMSSNGFFKNLGDGFSSFGSGMMKFFTGKK